jgi:hypothetical protein
MKQNKFEGVYRNGYVPHYPNFITFTQLKGCLVELFNINTG